MYCMFDLNGDQIKAEKGDEIVVDFQKKQDVGNTIENEQVMLISEDGDVKLGQPYIKDAKVKLEILDHFKGEKKISFKKRRRKGSKTKKGFRPHLTRLKVLEIEN